MFVKFGEPAGLFTGFEELGKTVSDMTEWEVDRRSHRMTLPQWIIHLRGEKVTADRVDRPLPGTEIARWKQVFQRVILLHFHLCPHVSLPLSFNSGLVLSSLKACPHTPSSSLCSVSRLLARCSPTKMHTHTKIHTRTQKILPTALKLCIRRCLVWLHLQHQPYIRGK